MTTANAIAQAVVAMSETREEIVRRQTLTCSSGRKKPTSITLLLSIASTVTIWHMSMISVATNDTLVASLAGLAYTQ